MKKVKGELTKKMLGRGYSKYRGQKEKRPSARRVLAGLRKGRQATVDGSEIVMGVAWKDRGR